MEDIERFEEWSLLKLNGLQYDVATLHGWVLRHTNGFVFDAFVNDELQRPFFGFDLAEAVNVAKLKRARSAIPVYETASITSIEQLHDALRQSDATVGIVRSWTRPHRPSRLLPGGTVISPSPDCTVAVRLRVEDDVGFEIAPYIIVQIGRDQFTRTFPRTVSGRDDANECAQRIARLLGVQPVRAETTISV